MSASRDLVRPVRQHLIDPEICIRCNTCEETCKKGAITHDRRSYAVRYDRCDACGECLPPCPTGAIDSWRQVAQPYSVADQLAFDSLPADEAPAGTGELPPEVAALVAAAGQGGAPPPRSASRPCVNLYAPQRPIRATVTGVHRLTADDAGSDIRHIVLDFGKAAFPVLEGQSIGVLPPGTDSSGQAHHVRLYSIASPRDGERPGYNNLALTVKRVTEDPEGRPVRGVASNYLCDLSRGDEVAVVGPYGGSFLMPDDPAANLLMVCTGTGAAPMRAMTERRRRRYVHGERQGGALMLFFGARTPGELPYFGPLMRLPRPFIDVNLAFSRQAGEPRRHVQDLLRARGADVARLLRSEATHVYLCGHKQMEAGVEAAFTDICRAEGMDFALLLPALRAAGRYHVETY